jgi:hypothetical protein
VRPADLSALSKWLTTRRGHGTVVRTVKQVIGGASKPAVAGPAVSPRTSTNLLANPSFEVKAKGTPDCWDATSFGDNEGTGAPTSDAHSGRTAMRLDVTKWTSGDRKIVVTQDLGRCAPPVTAGRTYGVTAYYKATAPVYATSFVRTRDGEWRFWSDGPLGAPSDLWSRMSWTTPPVPPDAQAISIGFGLKTTGSLTVDDAAMATNG